MLPYPLIAPLDGYGSNGRDQQLLQLIRPVWPHLTAAVSNRTDLTVYTDEIQRAEMKAILELQKEEKGRDSSCLTFLLDKRFFFSSGKNKTRQLRMMLLIPAA